MKSNKPELPIIGPTGQFPEGKLNSDDKGELQIAVGIRVAGPEKNVIMDFGTYTKWIGMGSEQAIALGKALIARGEELKSIGG